jgi:cob(I)alamin adenosyltransferase
MDLDQAENKKNIMKIATKTGDKGTTGTLFNGRVSKGHPQLLMGCHIDMLSAQIGLCKPLICKVNSKYKELMSKVQKDLILIMGELDASLADKTSEYISKYGSITDADLLILDKEVEFLQELDELQQRDWILYGKTELGARFDIAAKQCRLAELNIYQNIGIDLLRDITKQYINRLSDLLHLLARYFDYVTEK